MILLVLASSCKKDRVEQVRPTTFADFEKIMASDLNIRILTTTTSLLFQKTEIKENILSVNTVNKYKDELINDKELEFISQNAKNKDDMSIFFNKYNVEDANLKLNLIERQSQAYISFLIDYPEFARLNKNEIKKLLSMIVKNSQIKADPITKFLNNWSQGKIMGRDCAQEWAVMTDRCEIGYGVALVGIWADVAVASAVTAGFAAGPAVAGALVASGVAYLAKEICISWATDDFFACI